MVLVVKRRHCANAYSSEKYVENSLENLSEDILGLKGYFYDL